MKGHGITFLILFLNLKANGGSLDRGRDLGEFQLQDTKMMADLNGIFYGSSRGQHSISLHHGQKAEKVYVFLHGMFRDGSASMEVARKKFAEGANVIVGTLPGHEKQSLEAASNSAGVWLEYADYLSFVAKRYGKKVIFIGESTGANLAVRAAESGYVDELVLIQPLFALSPILNAGIKAGRSLMIKGRSRQNNSGCFVGGLLGRNNSSIEDIVNAVDQAEILSGLRYRSISPTVPVTIYVSNRDPVVSATATVAWSKSYAAHAKIIYNKQPWNHFYDPL